MGENKIVMKENKTKYMERYSVFMDRYVQYIKMSVLPNLVYRFNAISIKTQCNLNQNLNKLILKAKGLE